MKLGNQLELCCEGEAVRVRLCCEGGAVRVRLRRGIWAVLSNLVLCSLAIILLMVQKVKLVCYS